MRDLSRCVVDLHSCLLSIWYAYSRFAGYSFDNRIYFSIQVFSLCCSNGQFLKAIIKIGCLDLDV